MINKTITNPVIRDQVTFIQTSASTSGRVTTLQVTLMPGGGTPLHYHRSFSETFIVIEGQLSVLLENKTLTLSAGQKITVEKRMLHQFSNKSDSPVVFTTIVLPASEGFENALQILYGLARDQKTDKKGIPKNPLALAVVSDISDMHLAGAGVLLAPLMSIFRLIAGATGMRKKLLAAYCQE